MSWRARAEADEARQRVVDAAELVCLMVGWTGSQTGERGKALHELWTAWADEYRAAGGSLEPRGHPELSDVRIKELAAKRDATVARTRAAWAEDWNDPAMDVYDALQSSAHAALDALPERR